MITVEYAPGGSSPDPSSQCTCIYLCAGGLHRDAGAGRKTGDPHTGTEGETEPSERAILLGMSGKAMRTDAQSGLDQTTRHSGEEAYL